MAPGEQELPEAMVEPAVQVPNATVKSVPFEFVKGVAERITGPPEAVKVIVPVQAELEPEFTVGQLVAPETVSEPYAPVPVTVLLPAVP
jgi:hypothetical protein